MPPSYSITSSSANIAERADARETAPAPVVEVQPFDFVRGKLRQRCQFVVADQGDTRFGMRPATGFQPHHVELIGRPVMRHTSRAQR